MKFNRFITLVVLCALAFGLNTLSSVKASDDNKPLKPHVMVITMFGNEAAPWISHKGLTEEITVPGLSPNFPTVKCTPGPQSDGGNGDTKYERNICLVTTDQAYANAASSISALVYSGKFDLRTSYFLIAGIAGVDPRDGTLGSAAWARYSVDFGLAHEIDDSEKPAAWP